jgi:hypothetical protein
MFLWSALFVAQASTIGSLSSLHGFSVGDLMYLAVPLVGIVSTGALALFILRTGGDGRLLWLGASSVLALFFIIVWHASRAG